MKHHPFTKVWPLLEGDAFEKFKADIAANGQRLPVLTYKGEVLDGRNRERACEGIGVAARYEDSGAISDAEAIALVVSLNEHRRHLSKNQRILAAEALANIIHGHNQHMEKIVELSNDKSTISAEVESANQPMSLVAASRAMNVATCSVSKMRSIKKHGGQVAVEEVLSGKISLDAQHRKLRPTNRSPREKPSKRSGPGRPRKDDRRSTPHPYLGLKLPAMTPEQVDPEFTGTGIEFADKYGYVQVETAEQRATGRFNAWALNMRAVVKAAKGLPDWPMVDHNWLRKPSSRDVEKLAEALEYLRPKVAEAEALLARAQAAAKTETAA